MTDAYKSGREVGIREAAAVASSFGCCHVPEEIAAGILALLDATAPAPAMRLETVSENIARDMREGRFPERTPPQMVADSAPAPMCPPCNNNCNQGRDCPERKKQ